MGTENIFERIKKTGEDTFYRVNYETDNGKEMTEEEKREKAEDYIEKDAKTKKLLISTSIADNAYINNVIKAYVHKDTTVEKQLYKEPLYTDKEFEKLQKMFGLDGKKMEDKLKKYQEEMLKEMEVKKDNIPIVKPKKIKP